MVRSLHDVRGQISWVGLMREAFGYVPRYCVFEGASNLASHILLTALLDSFGFTAYAKIFPVSVLRFEG